MPRHRVDWKIKTEVWRLGERTLLVGAVNVAPDSVDDQGRYQDPDRAYVRAIEIIDQGADVLEIGADSFRHGSQRVAERDELQRLVPILKRLHKTTTPICVETCKAAVAEKALSMGVQIIKDPAGYTLDPDLGKVVARFDAGLLIQHMHGTPETWAKLGSMKDPAGTVLLELSASLSRATRAGVERERIAIDPGLGLGKRKEQNTELLVGLDQLNKLRLPIQVSPSGKAFAAALPVEACDATTIAASTMAILRGAHLLRLHDIATVRPAALITDQALRG